MKRRSCRNMHIMQIWRYLNASAPNWVEKINLNPQINLNGYTKTVEFVCLLEISIWSKILIQDVLILYQNKRQGDFFTQLFIGNNKIKLTFDFYSSYAFARLLNWTMMVSWKRNIKKENYSHEQKAVSWLIVTGVAMTHANI